MRILLNLQIAKPERDVESGKIVFSSWRRECVEFDAGTPACPHENFIDGFQAGLREMLIWERSRVKATLTVPIEWRNEKFSLQVGLDPDSVMHFSAKSCQDGVMQGTFESAFDEREEDGAELFWDTMGPTSMILRHERSGRDRRLLSIRIEVIPDRHRERVMRAVVDELIKLAPHTLSSTRDAQNKSAYDDIWSVGATSFAYPPDEFAAIKDVVLRLKLVMTPIAVSPAVEVSREGRVCQFARARCLSSREKRRFLGVVGQCRHDLLSGLRVRAEKAVRGFAVPAHRAMFDFFTMLDDRLTRLKRIAARGKHQAIENSWKMHHVLVGVGDPKIYSNFRRGYVHRIRETLQEAKEARAFEIEIDGVSDSLKALIRLDIFSGFVRSNSVNLMGGDFQFNRHYRQFYEIARSFMDKHHWWKPLEEGFGLTHSQVLLQNRKYGSELQRKYSILYEYWCVWRLIDAFEHLGFSFADAKQELRTWLAESIVVQDDYDSFIPRGVMESEDLEVYIVHNYAAYDPGINADAAFLTTRRFRHPLARDPKKLRTEYYETPDMAVILRNLRTDKWFWITLDAKSSALLRSRQVQKQWNYLHQMHTPQFDLESEQRPMASWLVYAGLDNRPCGLECVEGEDESFRCWDANDEDKIKEYMEEENAGVCSVATGLVLNRKRRDRRFLGEVRASPLTSPLSNAHSSSAAFLQFAKIQLETARRELGGL